MIENVISYNTTLNRTVKLVAMYNYVGLTCLLEALSFYILYTYSSYSKSYNNTDSHCYA